MISRLKRSSPVPGSLQTLTQPNARSQGPSTRERLDGRTADWAAGKVQGRVEGGAAKLFPHDKHASLVPIIRLSIALLGCTHGPETSLMFARAGGHRVINCESWWGKRIPTRQLHPDNRSC